MSIPAQGAVGAGQSYQERVRQHFLYVAGEDTTDMPERRDRACEEFAELQQALGGTLEGWIAVGRYVWGRPIGEPAQEMGGTLNTLAALAAWADLDMMACAEAELERTKQPEIVAKIRRKRANRHGRGVLPGNDADLVTAALASPRADSDERTAGEDLNDRLRAAGMFTIPEMMGETPLTRWEVHAGMMDLDFFERWLEAQVRQYLHLKARYDLGDKDESDELYEWTLAHVGAFRAILVNFKAARRATPAQPAGAVPDGLRALSEAAKPGELRVSPTHWGFVGLDAEVVPEQWDGNLRINGKPHLSVLSDRKEGLDYADAAFLAAAWNFVRSLLASHPAGQSAGSGAGNRERHLKEQLREAVDFLEMDEEASQPGTDLYTWLKVTEQLLSEKPGANDTRPVPQGRAAEIVTRWHDWIRDVSADMDEPEWPRETRLTMENDRDYLLSLLPAPDSTRTGQGEEETATEKHLREALTVAASRMEVASMDWGIAAALASDKLTHADDMDMWAKDARAALAARPAAPEAQGAWRDELEVFVAREWPEGRSAGAAARELARALGAAGIAPTLLRMLTELLSTINFASTDRAAILADFANAAPEAARTAKLDSFERWNPHVFEPAPPASSGREG